MGIYNIISLQSAEKNDDIKVRSRKEEKNL